MPELWPEVMKFSTAAAYIDREASYVQRLVRSGALRVIVLRVGGERMIRRKDLDDFIERASLEQQGIHLCERPSKQKSVESPR